MILFEFLKKLNFHWDEEKETANVSFSKKIKIFLIRTKLPNYTKTSIFLLFKISVIPLQQVLEEILG